MTLDNQKDILIQYQQKVLNSSFVKEARFGDDILQRLMVFTIPNSPRKKLVLLSNHKSPKVELELLIDALTKIDVYHYLPDWAGSIEYYTIFPVGIEKEKKYCQIANSRGISMHIYDYAFMINDEHLKNYITNKNDYEYQGLDTYNRGIYEILAYGSTSTDIKQRIIDSYILHALYQYKDIHKSIPKEQIIELLGLDKKITQGDINNALSSLRGQNYIRKDPEQKHNICLSEDGIRVVREAKAKSLSEEAGFKTELKLICEKYHLSANVDEVLTQIREFARNTYNDILLQPEEPSIAAKQSLLNYLRKVNASDSNACLQDFEILCHENPFVARISLGEIFVSNINSSEIKNYTKSVKKIIHLDTPVIIYWLCYLIYKQPKYNDWGNSRYQSTRDLIDFIDDNRDEIQLIVRHSYLKEVAGEIQKALRLQLLDNAHFEIPFSTNNTFYQYYQYIRKMKDLRSFSDFLNGIGISVQDVDNIHFSDRMAKNLQTSLLKCCDYLTIDSFTYSDEQFKDIISHMPQEYLKQRNYTPIKNDISQVLQIRYEIKSNDGSNNYFIATWDRIFCAIREYLQQHDSECIFYVSSPTQLASQLAMAHFSLSADILTDAMFISADTTNAIKDLYDNALSRLLIVSEEQSLHAINNLLEAQKQYMQTYPKMQEKIDEEGYPLENVIDSICSSVIEWGFSMEYLRRYIKDEEQFEQIKIDLDAGYDEIRKKKDYLNGNAINQFKEHLSAWAINHPIEDLESIEEDEKSVNV